MITIREPKTVCIECTSCDRSGVSIAGCEIDKTESGQFKCIHLSVAMWETVTGSRSPVYCSKINNGDCKLFERKAE